MPLGSGARQQNVMMTSTVMEPAVSTVDEESPKAYAGELKPLTNASATVVCIVPAAGRPGHKSHFLTKPFKEQVEWPDVLQHMAERLTWSSPNFKLKIFTEDVLSSPTAPSNLSAALSNANILLTLNVHDRQALTNLKAIVTNTQMGSRTNESAPFLPTILSFGLGGRSSPVESLQRMGGTPVGSFVRKVSARVAPWSRVSRALKTKRVLDILWQRRSSDDLLYFMEVLIDSYVADIPLVKSQLGMKEMGSGVLKCMWTNCQDQIIECMKSPACRQALFCLTNCPLNDQVCTYRCIVTHESPAFEAFSLCILQKHNCLNNSAPIPVYPRPEPLRTFKGKPLTYESAEDIYVGWLGQDPWSWKVVAGKNPAYDFFPNQHQIFYRGKRSAFWYDPVFRVTTYDGRVVWRRRHYRVKRAAEPGTFWFSVLDNGVTSNEYWTILDCADDFSWAIFHYSGAASVAGQQYRGALVVSRDGAWPKIDGMETRRRIEAALDKAGVKTWELYEVVNDGSEGAPLGLPDSGAPMAEQYQEVRPPQQPVQAAVA